MILHIGNGKTVRGEEIVGIFDLDNATLSKESRTFLSAATRAGEVSYADSDIPRAFLITAKKKQKVTAPTIVGEGSTLPPTIKKSAASSPAENRNRPRHPARTKKAKRTPPAQSVLLSHISSSALHARTDRPFDED